MATSTSNPPSVYTVTGMTCAHCVSAVTEEITQVPGVTGVEVDLAAGTVSVSSQGPLDDAAVAAAVEEAGYEVTATPPQSSGGCCGTCH
ncbi:heavy-metal-associated domain-containing protein [Streptomyces sp. ATMOS53]